MIKGFDFWDVRRVLFFVAVASTLALTGPFGTFYLPISTRAAYWVSWLVMIWAPCALIFAIAQRSVLRSYLPKWAISVGVFILSWPIVALCAVALASQYFPDFPVTTQNVVSEAKVLWPILFGLVLLLHFTHKDAPQRQHSELEVANPFLARLPANLGQDLLAISSADHYVQVKTDRGEALLLLSLKQAAEELHAYPGLRIHRGHWVALSAVSRKIWRDARLFLELKDGTQLPVGRSYRAQVLKQI